MRHRISLGGSLWFAGTGLLLGTPVLAQEAARKAAVPKAAAPKPAVQESAATAFSRFADAASTWADIQVQVKDLAQLLQEKRLDEVHPVAFEIRDLVRTLPDKSAGLPAAHRTKLQAQVRIVDRLAEQLDRYGDAGKLPETARQAKALSEVLATIERLYPAGALANPAAAAGSSNKLRDLYLTPGGLYTEADIQANGNQLPSQKFRGVRPEHDFLPKAGDRICPVTRTKANPGYTWVIGGKEYLFCCPPCVEEFVTKAKKSTAPLPDPESYVKKAD